MAWTDEQREHALELLREHVPLAEVHRSTGIPKQTLSGWAKRNEIDLGRTTEKTREAAGALMAKAAARRANLVTTLTTIAEKAVARELELIGTAELRDVVGARTRAIHDAELLSGQATERHETQGDARQRAGDLVDELTQRRQRKSA